MRSRVLAAAVTVASLLLWAPAALAAPPANDDFANAESLGLGLPVEVTRSNVEATAEAGDPAVLFAAGDSVWFEWEATEDRLVTVGTCGSSIDAVLGVYTGSDINALTEVDAGNNGGGPNCPSDSEVTFRATSGTDYKVFVDGNAFFVPEAPAPVTEGDFSIQIKATPTPANDDFADAIALGSAEAEAGSGFFFGSADGFNWNATKEAGEPEHEGDAGGASVWYRWAPPGSGPARIGVFCQSKFEGLVAVYVGDALGELTPVGTDEGCSVSFAAQVGTTYWVAVDGKFATTADMDNFTVSASVQLPPSPGSGSAGGGGSPPAADTTPPDTAIERTSLRAAKRSASFAFSSTEAGSTFRCRLDGGKLSPCKSPRSYKNLKPGRHVFRVVAVDPAGNVDRSPAVSRFQVVKARSGKKKRKR